jgi:serine/threonine protein kinase
MERSYTKLLKESGFNTKGQLYTASEKIISDFKSHYDGKVGSHNCLCVSYKLIKAKEYANKKKELFREIGAHPNLCTPLLIPPTSNNCYFFYEKSEYDIESYCNYCYQGKPVSASFIKPFLLQVLLGLEYLHSKGIPHGHLSAKNILIYFDTSNNPYAQVGGIKPYICNDSVLLDSDKEDASKRMSNDMRDFGCIIYNLYHQEKPLPLQTNIFEYTFAKENVISLYIIKLIAHCLCNANRITPKDAQKLDLFTNPDSDEKDITLESDIKFDVKEDLKFPYK